MEINYEEVFGVESEKEQEVAEPAVVETETDSGEKEQEAAEPAVEDENSKFAAARRKAEAERDRAIAEAKEEAKREIDEAFRTSGFVNPYTGKPVQSKAEFDAYKERYAQETRQKMQDRAGMSEEEMNAFIETQPEIQRAAQAAQELRQYKAQEFNKRVEAELEEIRQYEPEVNSVEDFPKMENFAKFSELVQRGNSYADAYKLANLEKVTQHIAAGAAKAAANKAASKAHLSATRSRGTGMETIPADVMAEYRIYFPNATEEELTKDYNNYLKGRK